MTTYLKNDQIHVSASTPKVKLEGTETSAGNYSIRENAGVVEIYDETAASSKGTIRPLYILVPILIPDSARSGLAATSTGIKWTSNFKFTVDTQNFISATLRATWTASDTDSVTAIEVYDATGASVLGSVSGNSGTDSTASITGFTTGNLLQVRLNVTTASATTTATTSLTYAVLEIKYGVA